MCRVSSLCHFELLYSDDLSGHLSWRYSSIGLTTWWKNVEFLPFWRETFCDDGSEGSGVRQNDEYQWFENRIRCNNVIERQEGSFNL